MNINHVAFLGCGPAGSCFVHGLQRRLSTGTRIDIHLGEHSSRDRAAARLSKLGTATHALNLTLDRQVSPDAQLIIIQIPKQPSGVTFVERQALPDCSDLTLVLNRFLETRRDDAQILRYTTSFSPSDRDLQQEGVGLLHYSNPAHLLPLVEIAPPTGSGNRVEGLRRFFLSAGYFPLVLEQWKPGFFSVRFQVRLLKAVEKIYLKEKCVDAKEIDRVIREAVQALLKLYRGASRDSPLLEPLRHSVMGLFQDKSSYLPLWNALVVTWRELRPGLTDWEIATALFGGPALRCLEPGFLSTIDIEGIPPFCGLMAKFFPEVDAELLESLICAGKIGGVMSGGVPLNGFYDWNGFSRNAAILRRDQCLAENAISLTT